MSSGQNRRWKKPEEPDWRTRENRGHTWFTNMKREKEKKNQGTKFCQRCYSTGHYTYECKNERVYQVRPSETQQLKHPKLVRPLTTELPPDVLEKQQKERDALIKQTEALLATSKKKEDGDKNEGDSYSDYSYSYSYSYSKPDEKGSDGSYSYGYSYSYSYSDDMEGEEKNQENGKKDGTKKESKPEAFNILNGKKAPEDNKPIKLVKRKDAARSRSPSYSYSYSYSYSDEEKENEKKRQRDKSNTKQKDEEMERKRVETKSNSRDRRRAHYSSSSDSSD